MSDSKRSTAGGRVEFSVKLGIQIAFTTPPDADGKAERWDARDLWLSVLPDDDALKRRMTTKKYITDMLLRSVFSGSKCAIVAVNKTTGCVKLSCPADRAQQVLCALENGIDTWMEAIGWPFELAEYYDEPGTPDFAKEPKALRALKTRIGALARPALPKHATVASLEFTFQYAHTAALTSAAKTVRQLE